MDGATKESDSNREVARHYRAKAARLKREANEAMSKGTVLRLTEESSKPAAIPAPASAADGTTKVAAGPAFGMKQRQQPVANSDSGRANATTNGGGGGVKGPVSEAVRKQRGAPQSSPTPHSSTSGEKMPGEKAKEKRVTSDVAEVSAAKKNGAAKTAKTNGTTDAENKKLGVADDGGSGACAGAGAGGDGDRDDGKKDAGDTDGRKKDGNDGSAPQHVNRGSGSGTGASAAASSPAAEDAAVAPSSPSSSSANASAAAAAAQQQKPKSPPPTKRKYTKRREKEKVGSTGTGDRKNAKVAKKKPADAKSKLTKPGKRAGVTKTGKATSGTKKTPTSPSSTAGERRSKVVSVGVVGRNGHVVGSPANYHVTTGRSRGGVRPDSSSSPGGGGGGGGGDGSAGGGGDGGGGGGARSSRKRARPDGVGNMELDRAIAAEQQKYAMSMNARRAAAAAAAATPPAPQMMMMTSPATAAAASSPPMMNGGNKAAASSPSSSPSASTVTDHALPFPVPQAASIAYSLAGPYVQGLINGNQSILETIEGDTETSVNEMTTKLLLSATDGAGSTSSGGGGEDSAPVSSSFNAESTTVTLSLSEMDNVAKEMVIDRRSATREAVQFAFVEMKKRHDTILDMYREQLCATVQREATKQKRMATMEQARTTNEIVRQLQSKHDAQVKKIREDQAKLIKDMIKSHCEEVARLKDELDGVRSNHSRALDSYRMAANSQVLALCTKKKKKKKRAVVR